MRQFARFGCCLALGLLLSASAQSAVIYEITVTTSAPLNGTAGIVNMQFNPGDINVQPATADVTSFSGALLGVVEPPLPGNGIILGDLASTLSFTNTSGLNDFAQNVTFGPFFQFVLTLDGPALNAPDNGLAGTRFSLLLYESAFLGPLGTTNGVILTIDVNPDGTVTTEGFPTGNAIVSIVDISDVPEPSTWSLCAGTFAAFYVFSRRKSRN